MDDRVVVFLAGMFAGIIFLASFAILIVSLAA